MELMDNKQDLPAVNPLQQLRCLLQNGHIIEPSSSLLEQSLCFELLPTCQQLLAFQQYHLFEAVMKKHKIKQIELLQCQNTRNLFQAYRMKVSNIKSRKINLESKGNQSTDNKQERSGENNNKRFLHKILKIFIVVFSLLFASGLAFKYRAKIINLFKLLLNLK